LSTSRTLERSPLPPAIDACHAACTAAHADHPGPIGDRDYDLRDFSVIDLWAYMIVFQEVIETRWA